MPQRNSLPSSRTLTLLTVPLDVLYTVFQILHDAPGRDGLEEFGHEVCKSARLIPLSATCRYMRSQTLPWIFREVYNWNRANGDVWPDTLWPFFITVHIRDRSIRHPADLALPPDVFRAFPMMGALTKVTVRMDAAVPAELLHGLSMVPSLTTLEIHQARFDGTPLPLSLPFTSLESLRIGICGFQGCFVRSDTIDRTRETGNVFILLKNVSDRLMTLQISGDLLPPDFLALDWPCLREFTISDHTPSPYTAVPDLVCRMPVLRELSILYSPDATRTSEDIQPPFKLGTAGGGLLTDCSPRLTTLTLSNLGPADPIFAQLPRSLETLHLLTMQDEFEAHSRPAQHREFVLAPFTPTTLPTALHHLSHLQDLTELSLTLDAYSTAHLIGQIAAVFPRLRVLEIGNAMYYHGEEYCYDVRDETIVTAIRQFPALIDLRIALDFPARDDQVGSEVHAARWFLARLPGLRSIAFLFDRAVCYFGYPAVDWRTWDRSVLLRPPTPPSPPRSVYETWEPAPAIL
ncbi:hypothetical protein B0H15DRAFT_431224 [Mycena belliarum]|uniref:F-box domain-containing protein n=1 Tax=Mycena belliarum TaxID=1033014 RepID=A0AAD6U161_9AGAR|nr:hypothetical protein B0H15DRAFT_431224 [Mycena belliae]